MDNPKNDDPVVINQDDARGALAEDEVPVGDTMLPTLITGMALAVLGAIVILAMYYLP